MPVVIPGYTLQDVVLGNINSLSISRVGGGDFQVSFGFDLEDEFGDVRESLTYAEVLSGAQLSEFVAFVAARLPAVNAYWPGQV
jgi:hypothetical protein